MARIHDSSKGEPAGDDAASLVARHETLDSSFWIEHGEAVLEVSHIRCGAEGFLCLWHERTGHGTLAAIGGGRHGLALAFDGGAEPFVIDSACAIDRDAAVAVVERFLRDGGRSEAVRWGAGIVRTTMETEEGWVLEEIGQPSGPRGWLPGGLRSAVGGPLDPALPQTASWRVLSELLVCDVAWLQALAETPMPALRRVVVDARAGSLAALPAAVAAAPALEELLVIGAAVLQLPPLASPTLRHIGLGLGELADPVEDPPSGWFNTIAAALARCELPALVSASIEATIEAGIEL
ncbi:hypothetical protein SAMN02745121_03941 [Nannocystis exedens]|uniref:Uncharacterized protein n=1 Tax=Nannocystis exedens TaxID=54 RepID=A0A1I1ZSN4_9BACT|nr:hypothetical protein [Nannocystis exedens]PCC75334.1 hypothetical protein NAEX_08444 [Nannocystis exedens]SFE34681.1 hypothetical protein SAMN02745121_03941 [Nannocystis exedens]